MPSQQSAHVNEGTDKSIPLKEISQTLRSSDESTILDNSVNRQKTPPSGTILWLQVLACFCVHFVTGGWAGCAGLFQIHYTKSLHKSAHDVAWITGLETFFTFVPSALVGRLCDLGYLKSSMFLGNLFLSVGGLVISWGTQNIDMLIAVQGVVMGIAKCLVWIPSTFIICTYFEDKRLPVALAVIHAGSAIGSLIFPIILEYAQKQIGFQAALRIMAAISFGLLMISLCLFQSREKLENLAKGTLLHGGAFKKAAYCMIVVTSLVMCAGGAAGGTFANSYGSKRSLLKITNPGLKQILGRGDYQLTFS